MEPLKQAAYAVAMYAATGIATWIASRYHLDGQQTAAVTSDIVAIGLGASGVALHVAALFKQPPK